MLEGWFLASIRWQLRLTQGNDELTQWARGPGRRLFLHTDAVVAASLGKVSQWATSQRYEPAAINTFFQSGDYYLVAHALARQCVVVTHEVPSISTRRIKIPNACMGLSIQFMTPYEMLRREQARFVLGNPGGSP